VLHSVAGGVIVRRVGHGVGARALLPATDVGAGAGGQDAGHEAGCGCGSGTCVRAASELRTQRSVRKSGR
jgi:hypothetical protein